MPDGFWSGLYQQRKDFLSDALVLSCLTQRRFSVSSWLQCCNWLHQWNLRDCLYGRDPHPKRWVLSQKESLEKRKGGWEGRSRRGKGQLAMSSGWRRRREGGKMDPFWVCFSFYSVPGIQSSPALVKRRVNKHKGTVQSDLKQTLFSLWLVCLAISCQENMEKCCFASVLSGVVFSPSTFWLAAKDKPVACSAMGCLGHSPAPWLPMGAGTWLLIEVSPRSVFL